jgi:Rps23 Pro-64 3,4-dihydroxylase Tpa1-like proline 4-hydroxylase
MKQREIAPGIVAYDDVFVNSYNLVKGLEDSSLEWTPAKILVDNPVSQKEESYRSTDMILMTQDRVMSDSLLYSFLQEFNKEIVAPLQDYFGRFNANATKFEIPQLLRYGVGQNFKIHIDDHANLTRRVSLVYYINDDYTGGELFFDKFGLEVKPMKNQLIIFPSNFMYSHEARAVTDGTKYAIVQWME